MFEPREHQSRAKAEIETKYAEGKRSVCLVCPTGGGKTNIGAMVTDGRKTLIVAHTRSLVDQLWRRFSSIFGVENVGMLMAGRSRTPLARYQVASVDTLLSRGAPDDVELLILDECHHYVAETYRQIAEAYPSSRTLGLTATPERQDGKALGDIHDAIVLAASYSELIGAGYLVPAKVLAPSRCLGSDLAQDPVDAWFDLGKGSRTLMYFHRVDDAERACMKLTRLGVSAGVVHGAMKDNERAAHIEMFEERKLLVLCSCDTLTEGFDVPGVQTIVSAKPLKFVSTMLQVFGRGLRAHPGKERVLILDLTGASRRHGSPCDDRTYSLKGRAISSTGTQRSMPERPPGDLFKQSVVGAKLRPLRANDARIVFKSHDEAVSADVALSMKKFRYRFGKAGSDVIEAFAKGESAHG